MSVTTYGTGYLSLERVGPIITISNTSISHGIARLVTVSPCLSNNIQHNAGGVPMAMPGPAWPGAYVRVTLNFVKNMSSDRYLGQARTTNQRTRPAHAHGHAEHRGHCHCHSVSLSVVDLLSPAFGDSELCPTPETATGSNLYGSTSNSISD